MHALWLALSIARASDADPVLDALRTELARAQQAWEGAEDAPYYLAYRVVDEHEITLAARYGALHRARPSRTRTLGVIARVGSPELDNTHEIRGSTFSTFDATSYNYEELPVDGDPRAIRLAAWRQTEHAVRQARERIVQVRANHNVRVAEEDRSGDFSADASHQWLGEPVALSVDEGTWAGLLTSLSRRVDASPEIERSEVALWASTRTQTLVASDGTEIREPRVRYRLSMWAATSADDGQDITLYRWRDVEDPAELPDAGELGRWADATVRDVVALREAPRGEPYSGPLLLKGRAAGVFVHEVIGHRVEGHRQKSSDEGQTFKGFVGREVLPKAISIVDDPTLDRYAGVDLNGYYHFDEEGQPAQRAVIVDQGVFRGFLMSRSPIEGFAHSNGHGRAQEANRPVARMANTILETTDPKPVAELRKMLIAEARAQGREFGLIVDELDGGFTLTGRVFPNAFNLRATTAWRVYVDGRPDELVRGIDLVGTPLVALGNVVAAGDDPDVFNGYCGAESGMVPNAAVSPSLLLRELEIQRKEKGQSRGPLLPRPEPGGDS